MKPGWEIVDMKEEGDASMKEETCLPSYLQKIIRICAAQL
jgi:hypothetical protein